VIIHVEHLAVAHGTCVMSISTHILCLGWGGGMGSVSLEMAGFL